MLKTYPILWRVELEINQKRLDAIEDDPYLTTIFEILFDPDPERSLLIQKNINIIMQLDDELPWLLQALRYLDQAAPKLLNQEHFDMLIKDRDLIKPISKGLDILYQIDDPMALNKENLYFMISSGPKAVLSAEIIGLKHKSKQQKSRLRP